ncbi:rRNA-binding ribosome biosynthesis protein rpf2, partial [Cladochytrium tenue]
GSRLPRVELTDCGPSVELSVGRHRLADDDLFKKATRTAPQLQPKTEKNVERDAMGDKIGRVHMHKQDFGKLQTRKMKGLKRQRDEDEVEGVEGDDVVDDPARKK